MSLGSALNAYPVGGGGGGGGGFGLGFLPGPKRTFYSKPLPPSRPQVYKRIQERRFEVTQQQQRIDMLLARMTAATNAPEPDADLIEGLARDIERQTNMLRVVKGEVDTAMGQYADLGNVDNPDPIEGFEPESDTE